MKHADIIKQMTLEEKCYLFSGKDFWQTRSLERLGVPNMTLSDGPHGIRKQAGEGDQLGLNPSLPATCYPTAATVAAVMADSRQRTAAAAIPRPTPADRRRVRRTGPFSLALSLIHI